MGRARKPWSKLTTTESAKENAVLPGTVHSESVGKAPDLVGADVGTELTECTLPTD